MRLAWADHRYTISQNVSNKKSTLLKPITQYSCNFNEICIQISTNMPGLGSLIRETDVNISEILESKNTFSKTNAGVLPPCSIDTGK